MIFPGRDSEDSLREAIRSMESQLVALYEEHGHGSGGEDLDSLKATIRSLEEQLITLYHEKELMGGEDPRDESVASLEEQVVALTNEKMDLERKIEKNEGELERMRTRAGEIGAALVTAALFGKGKDWITKL